MNKGAAKIKQQMKRHVQIKSEVKTSITKDDLRAMLAAFEGKIEVVAQQHMFYRYDMCKSKWTKKGGINLCNFVNPVERAKSVMEVLKR